MSDAGIVEGRLLFACPACGASEESDGDIERQVVRCDSCGALITYGVAMPRIVAIQHPDDARFVQIAIEQKHKGQTMAHVVLSLSREFAAMLGRDLIGCAPKTP